MKTKIGGEINMFGMSKEEVKYMCESQGAIFVDVDEIFGAGMWDFDDLISLMKDKTL
ncbi:hypothetical protein [Trichococcus shcherbakoviae]|uniref:hypothetical protein n=1 Tax=Trichococcus shcherbakoviae TaxID=2094020 RepID=UPI002AA7B2AD|nr:hypothetical protein [Trichococcus shcherbakoviae]